MEALALSARARGSAPGSIWVTVKRQRQVVPLKVELLLSHTIGDLKDAIAELGSVPRTDQRIFARSCQLFDEQTLEACGLAERPEVQLVPVLGHKAALGVSGITARRGYNMVPGNLPWRPSRVSRLTSQDIHEFWGPGDDTPGPRPRTAPAPQLPSLPPLPALPTDASWGHRTMAPCLTARG